MEVGPIRDRMVSLTLPGERPLRITLFGTSLSSGPRYDWPLVFERALARCLDHPVELTTVTRPGATIDWAASQVGQIRQTAPDLILMEFATNDADLLDGVSRSRAMTRTSEVVRAIATTDLAGDPAPGVVLMAMNPARGLRGVLRPWLDRHYADYRALAAEADLGFVDLEARWLELPRGARGLAADGLHPDPAVARDVIVPALVTYLREASTTQTACAEAWVRPPAWGRSSPPPTGLARTAPQASYP